VVGAAATGLVVFVFALIAPVLAAGPAHAAKNVDAAANKINGVIFFITNLPRRYSISKGEFNLQVEQVKFVFAPEERDVYSCRRPLKDLAPLGAKPGTS
jgi:hypothetical protein